MEVNQDRVIRARQLFTPNGSNEILSTTFEGLGAELGNRLLVLRSGQGFGEKMPHYHHRVKVLTEAMSYATERLTEVLVRLQAIEWMKDVLAYENNPDPFVQASDPRAIAWRLYLGLAIKDFHVDIGSLMDALAPVIIQAGGELKAKDRERLPGWAAIQKGTDRSYRQELPDGLLKIVDDTDTRWWTDVKNIRDRLTHRKHDNIIFGDSENGVLFQIYDGAHQPQIVLPLVLYRRGHNVVDFDLYSAFVLAEVLTLLDDLGTIIAPKVNISQSRVAEMSLRQVHNSVGQSIDRLIRAICLDA